MNKKRIRQAFRDSVFKRDNYTCKICGAKGTKETLNAHHITDRNEMPNGGYVKENGITVCEGECHLLCERYHMNCAEKWSEGIHPNDLYFLIGSSIELATTESKKLK
jgi:5-methylcytosine-specific restriction endonuclease McrA